MKRDRRYRRADGWVGSIAGREKARTDGQWACGYTDVYGRTYGRTYIHRRTMNVWTFERLDGRLDGQLGECFGRKFGRLDVRTFERTFGRMFGRLDVWMQARSWPGGSGGPDPPELLRVTFLNRVNPETFCGGRG